MKIKWEAENALQSYQFKLFCNRALRPVQGIWNILEDAICGATGQFIALRSRFLLTHSWMLRDGIGFRDW